MNKTTKVSLVVGLLVMVFAVQSAVAQFRGGGDPEQMIQRQMDQLKERLSLTADQEPQVRAILEESTKKQMKLREEFQSGAAGDGPPMERMGKMRAMRQETADNLSKVLTEDQMEEYEKMQLERRGRRGGRGGRPDGPGGPPPGPPPNRI